jgi:CRISPR-associated protein (TIGR03986 family)
MHITSAYNFAPLSRHVVQPEWQELVSHDVPLRDGLCAELDVELEAHTPLLVGGTQRKASANAPGEVGFYRLPDGRPAVPGSSLRGMLRNVLEIATFARLAPVMDDRALSLRDLSSSDNDYVRTLVDGNGLRNPNVGAKPRARSGWLWFDGSQWRLEPVACARVEQNLIKHHFGLGDDDWPRYDDRERRKRWRPTAERKRKLLLDAVARNPLAGTSRYGHVHVRFRLANDTVHRHGDKWLAYREVLEFVPMKGAGERKFAEGVLVCTGQPGPGKHMEFVFQAFARKAESSVVPADVMAAFQQVHDDAAGDWQRLWKGLAAQRVPVPVFFLGGDGDGRPVSRLGLAQMFRLPGRHRLGELADLAQSQAPGHRLDFVQTLFGHVVDGQPPLKGRVAFGDMVPVAGAPVREADAAFQQPTVLGQPKPGFYPNYFKQDGLNGQLKPGAGFATILSPQPPQLRGWKRYPVRPATEVEVPAPPEKSRSTVQVQLRPLAAGCRFRGTIRLHNVKPQELGAVLWALDFGAPAESGAAAPALRHALGMGKPFGFGQVSLRPCALRVRPNDPQAEAPTAEALRRTFEDFMQGQVPNWRQCDALRELRAMANPNHPGATKRALAPPREPKTFMEFKKREVRAVLLPYSQVKG